MGQRTSTPTRCHHKCSQILILLIFLTRGWSLIKYFFSNSSFPHLSGDCRTFDFCTYNNCMVTQRRCYTSFIVFMVSLVSSGSLSSLIGSWHLHDLWLTERSRLVLLTQRRVTFCWIKWTLWWTVTTQTVSWLSLLIGRHHVDIVRMLRCPRDGVLNIRRWVSDWVLITHMSWDRMSRFGDVPGVWNS